MRSGGRGDPSSRAQARRSVVAHGKSMAFRGLPPSRSAGPGREGPGVGSMIQRFGRPRCVHGVRRISGLYLGKEFPDAYSLSFAPGNVWPGVAVPTVAVAAPFGDDDGAYTAAAGQPQPQPAGPTIIMGCLAGVTASSVNVLMSRPTMAWMFRLPRRSSPAR